MSSITELAREFAVLLEKKKRNSSEETDIALAMSRIQVQLLTAMSNEGTQNFNKEIEANGETLSEEPQRKIHSTEDLNGVSVIMTPPSVRNGIPIPDRKRRGPPRKHPIDKLNVSESLRINASYNSVMICCDTFVKRYQPNWEFRIIKIDRETTDVWRVK